MNCKLCHRAIPDDSKFCCYCGAAQEDRKKKKHKRNNGMGYVYKRGKTYTLAVCHYVNGERIRTTKGGFKTIADASAYAVKLQEGFTAPKKETLSSLWGVYSTSAMLKLATSKQGAYKRAFGRMKGIQSKDISNITIKDLQDIVDTIPTYYPAREFKNLASHLFKMAQAEQLIHVNLAEFISLPVLEEKEAEHFTVDEVEKLWNAYRNGESFVGYILLMIYTGMMPAELQALKLDMINLTERRIDGAGKKTARRKSKPIVLPDAIVPVVEELCCQAKDDKLLPMSRDAFYETFKPTLSRVGVRPLNAYSCRHTTGTLSIGDITKKKELMRHASISTTQRYTHASASDALDVANTIPN